MLWRTPELSAKYQEYAAIIWRSGQHLLKLINTVLEMSKLEAKRAVYTETGISLQALIREIEELFRLQAEQKSLFLSVECVGDVPRFIYSDECKLRQILINLLGNAIKFTEKGGISLRVHSDSLKPQLGDHDDAMLSQVTPVFLSFEVQDTGVGMSEKECLEIFEPFSQAAAGRQSEGGTGLGLAISQSYAKLLGGQITVESEPGKGSCFCLQIQAYSKQLDNAA